MGAHRRGSPWWEQQADLDIQEFATLSEARAVENDEICRYDPPFNVRGGTGEGVPAPVTAVGVTAATRNGRSWHANCDRRAGRGGGAPRRGLSGTPFKQVSSPVPGGPGLRQYPSRARDGTLRRDLPPQRAGVPEQLSFPGWDEVMAATELETPGPGALDASTDRGDEALSLSLPRCCHHGHPAAEHEEERRGPCCRMQTPVAQRGISWNRERALRS
jgi:hypothetical protein